MASAPIFQSSGLDTTSFFSINDTQFLHLVHREFTPELDRLKRAYSISNEKITRPSIKSPSHILFGEEYDEVNRTLTSVLALRWLYNDQYETFVGTQPSSLTLTRSSFQWMRDFVTKEIKTIVDLYTLLTSIVVNDLGKDPQLALDYKSKTGKDISSLNHDIILLKAVESGLVPCLDNLLPANKADLIRGMALGAELNFGQLAQAENVPHCLRSLHEMRGHQRAFNIRFVEQLLDVSGAAGHEDWTCAQKLTQPIFECYRNVYEVAMGVISRELDLREGYDVILIRKGAMLRENGFERIPDVTRLESDENRALLRLFCMGGVTDLETAKLYHCAWEGLDSNTRDSLVLSLNLDGSMAEPAVQPTYMPAMLGVGVDAAGSGSREEKALRLQSILRYLARVMTLTDRSFIGKATVVECSVLSVVNEVIKSDAFREDPSILDKIEVPELAIEFL